MMDMMNTYFEVRDSKVTHQIDLLIFVIHMLNMKRLEVGYFNDGHDKYVHRERNTCVIILSSYPTQFKISLSISVVK